MPALQGIEVSIGNPWLMLSWWQGEITSFSSTTRAIVFVSLWKYKPIKTFPGEYTKI